MDKDGNLLVTVGDLQSTKFNQNMTGYDTKAQNILNGTSPDGRAGILRITQEGKSVGSGILGDDSTLNLYYAYGIKNSFGIGIDPLTDNVWDTENGPQFGDEINLVKPGFNSGWEKVQGIWKLNQTRE
jgi:glucose/arabinose dehydrogenase